MRILLLLLLLLLLLYRVLVKEKNTQNNLNNTRTAETVQTYKRDREKNLLNTQIHKIQSYLLLQVEGSRHLTDPDLIDSNTESTLCARTSHT